MLQQDAIRTGRLELLWGDASPQAPAVATFSAILVDDAGGRQALDAAQALRAAGDLYAMYGRRIAVGFSTRAEKSASGAITHTRRIDSIVPIDDLSPPIAFWRAQPLAQLRKHMRSAAGDQPIAGVTSWVTLMCKFSDIATEQKPQSFFASQYGNAIGQLDNYWQEVSYGQINLAGSNAYGWYTLPQPRGYYVTTDTSGKNKADLGKLYTDCTAAADADVNFAINGGVQGINMMFNGDLDGYAWGGGRCSTLDGVNKCWSTTWNPPWSFGNLAPLSHEMGHAYGLPHANNSDGDSDPYDNPWDVMSSAWNNAVSNPTYGSLPKHINMYSRDRLGWVTPARKLTMSAGSTAQSITVDRASLAGSINRQMLVLRYPDQSTRYYIVEVRKRTGNYEARLAGDAVIIHAVDTARSEPAWSVDTDTPPANVSNNEGSMFKVGETWASPDNVFRLRVEAETANGFVLSVRSGQVSGGTGQPQWLGTKTNTIQPPAPRTVEGRQPTVRPDL